jgi:hypothetical protein
MPQWVEISGSRAATVKRIGKKDKSTVTVKFAYLGSYNDGDVHLQANIFFSTNRFYNIGGVIFLVESYDLQHVGGDAWEVTATYESLGTDDEEQPEPLKRTRQFDTSGGTAHFTVARGEQRYGANAPDMKKAIGVDGDKVNGVDVVIPALQWSETYDVPSLLITNAYIKTLADVTGTVNSSAFRSFDADEVLFVGASGQQQWDEEKGDGPWNLTFKFVASNNEANLSMGGIDGISKKGHEYLWAYFDDTVANNKLIKTPKFVYVNQIYRRTSFSQLGIGS